MRITLRAVLWKHKPDKAGKCPIAISIAGGGKQTYYNTKLKCSPDNWKDGKIRKPEINHDVKKATIEALIRGAEREILNRELQGEAVTLEDAKLMFNPKAKTGDSFIKFFRQYLDLLQTKFTKGYVIHFEIEYNFLVKAFPALRFKEVTAEFLEQYEMKMTCKPTTKHTKMKRLKEVVKKAIERGLIEPKQVAGYKLPAYKAVPKNYLTLAETEKIGNAIYSGEFDSDTYMKQVACYFLIGCYSGIRVSDWSRFTTETLISGEHLKVIAQKNKEPIYIPLSTFARLNKIVQFVKDNCIEFTITGQAVNRILKEMQKVVKITTPLHAHLSRHTAATLLAEMRYSTYEISQVLGISEKVAALYRKTTRKGMEETFSNLGGL